MPNAVPYFRPRWAPKQSRGERRAAHRASDHNYDRTTRDRNSKRFYDSAGWARLRVLKLVRTPYCEDCFDRGDLVPAIVVHHVVELRQSSDDAHDLDNLRSLCKSCHSRHHARNRHGDDET